MMVKNSKFKDYIDPVPEYKFLNGWTHHFWKWKPFVLYEHMKTMEDGDIVVYHDCDILKDKEYEKGVSNFRENVLSVLENSELVCSMNTMYGRNRDTTKEDVFLQFADFSDTKTLNTNRMFIRKNTKTLQFIYNWMILCNTKLLLPNYVEKHNYSESLFNVLYYKYIEMGEFNYPNIYFKDNLFSVETLFFLDKQRGTIAQKKRESFIEPNKTVSTPVRRMLPPHQSTRSLAMAMIPIAKPPSAVIRKPPPSFFTLNKSRSFVKE
jgi:hypothetical protein